MIMTSHAGRPRDASARFHSQSVTEPLAQIADAAPRHRLHDDDMAQQHGDVETTIASRPRVSRVQTTLLAVCAVLLLLQLLVCLSDAHPRQPFAAQVCDAAASERGSLPGLSELTGVRSADNDRADRGRFSDVSTAQPAWTASLQLAQAPNRRSDRRQTAQARTAAESGQPPAEEADAPSTQTSKTTESDEKVRSAFLAVWELVEGRRKEAAAARQQMTTLEQKIDANSEALEEIHDDLNGKAIRDAISNDIGRTLADAIQLMQKEIDRVEEQSFGLANNIDILRREVTRREARREDVALVVFHSKRLDGNLFVPLLKRVFLQDNYRVSFANYRLGLFRAANGTIEATQVDLQPDMKRPVLPKLLEFQTPDPDSTEKSQSLNPQDIFQSVAPSTRRRVVIVASSEAEPPKLDDPGWENIQCYTILVDQTGREKEATSEAWKKWEAFCARRSKKNVAPPLVGEASLISFERSQDQVLPTTAEAQFERILRWYIRPLR